MKIKKNSSHIRIVNYSCTTDGQVLCKNLICNINQAVVAEWLEQYLYNPQRQQSCSDPGSNPAWDMQKISMHSIVPYNHN